MLHSPKAAIHCSPSQAERLKAKTPSFHQIMQYWQIFKRKLKQNSETWWWKWGMGWGGGTHWPQSPLNALMIIWTQWLMIQLEKSYISNNIDFTAAFALSAFAKHSENCFMWSGVYSFYGLQKGGKAIDLLCAGVGWGQNVNVTLLTVQPWRV